MNQFVQECRREWKRLRVPDRIADEMALDLTADLEEAESEGASAIDVLGSGAADPRSFAASWARERGVVPAPSWAARLSARSLAYAAIGTLTIVAAVGAALTILAPPGGAPAALTILAPPDIRSAGAVWIAAPADAERIRVIGPSDVSLPRFGQPDGSGVNITGSILLTVGIAGIVLTLLILLSRHVARRESAPG